MELYRVTNKRFADNFNGRGASFKDGARWNSTGNPVIYFALDLGTAMIGAANYHASPRLVPPSYCKATYLVEEGVSTEYLSAAHLPGYWDMMPYPKSTQRIRTIF